MTELPSFPTVPVLVTADERPMAVVSGGEPRRIGPYTLTGVLGTGGMGVVYRAEQVEPLRRTVALKLVRRGLDTDRLVARFEAERLALARMSHSGIARVLDAGTSEDGRPYFVMELVEGQPLTDFCDAQRLDVAARLALFVSACRAVQHAHQKGIVHRDLKPSNILVTTGEGAPTPKVIDFGIAKAIADVDAETALLTREGSLVGTPDYMSPEQAGVIESDVDTRTDVYALGVVLYELLAGRRPHRFSSGTRDEVQRVLRHGGTARPSALAGERPTAAATTVTADPRTSADRAAARQTTPDRLQRILSGDLDTIVLKAMAYEPARRYASVDQLAEDVERYLMGRPVLARPDSWVYRTRKFVARHRLAVAASGVAAAALVAFSVVTALQAARVARERDRAEAVNQFLVGMFEEAAPDRALGDRLTAVQLVERGAATLQTELRDQPDVRATLLLTLSRVHGALGRWTEAEQMAADAVALREGGEAGSLADALVTYGHASRMAGHLPDAEAALRRALALRGGASGRPTAPVAQVLHTLAFVLLDLGRDRDAEDMFREALRLRRAAEVPPAIMADSLLALGDALRSQSRYRDAETSYREALALRRATLSPNHPRVITTERRLAQILNFLDRNEDAETLFRGALARADTVLGPDHPDTEGIVNDLASLLHDRGKLDQAEPLYLRAAATSRQHGDSMAQAQQLNNLATLYEDQGRFGEALTLYRESLAMRQRARGPRHPAVATALNNLGRLAASQGELAEGERLLREALSIRLESNGADHLLTARTRNNIGRVLRMRGATGPSLDELTQALAIQTARLPVTHPHVLQTRLERARTLAARGALAEAEADARIVLDARMAAPDAQPWERAEARMVLAQTLPASRAREARRLLAEARPVLVAAGEARRALVVEADRTRSSRQRAQGLSARLERR